MEYLAGISIGILIGAAVSIRAIAIMVCRNADARKFVRKILDKVDESDTITREADA